MYTTAVIPGSFDPITAGHADIILRVIVAVSPNSEKKSLFPAGTRLAAVKAAIAHIPGAEAVLLPGLLSDFAAENSAVIVKGARGACDFDYEKSLYDINGALGGIETVILPARKELQFISSTFVRELIKYNRPLDGYVPAEAIPLLVRAV